MKDVILKLVLAVTLGMGSTGSATVYNFTGSGNNYSAGSGVDQGIPDYPGSGPAFALNFNVANLQQITGISVTFTTTGGWNGDLYAYLSHGSGLAVLLNKVGAGTGSPDGYGTSGFANVTLSMNGVTDIHTVSSPGAGPYAADGRLLYTDTTRNNKLDVFNGVNPNGSWTLYFGDLAGGDTATITDWSVSITAIPEPINVALGLFGVCFVVAGIRKRLIARRAQA